MPDASIFTHIINREIPAIIQYEDDEFIAIDDIKPLAPIHVLLIPKKPYKTLEEVALEDEKFHARYLQLARKIAQKLGISGNYKLLMNVGEQVQMVHHVHLHIMGGWEHTATVTENI
jgi:histidine triad (HIT) family protein